MTLQKALKYRQFPFSAMAPPRTPPGVLTMLCLMPYAAGEGVCPPRIKSWQWDCSEYLDHIHISRSSVQGQRDE